MAHHNSRGVIAEQYSELQAIAVLERARETYPLAAASPQSTLRAVFQAVEIALLNLEDLLSRAALDIKRRQFGPASVKMSWACGFHRVLVTLSLLPHQLGLIGKSEETGVLGVSDSPALGVYLEALRSLDESLAGCLSSSELNVEKLLAEDSLDCNELRLLHFARICNHETTVWECNLAEIRVPIAVPSYETFVVASVMRDAVYDRVLEGDTFFTQFRGLHQIPEILCTEINDRLEQSIVAIRAGQPRAAYEHLRSANILSAGILASLTPMTENLVTSDYHEIRENLGLTSGSHSVNLHYHLFKDLYQQLWESMADWIMDGQPHGEHAETLTATLRDASRNPDRGANTFLFNLLGDECLQLRAFIRAWRDEHLQLPRNNLGGNRTKSLTGSLDAIKAVKGMKDAARIKDPMQPLAIAHELRDERNGGARTPITEYLESPESMDSRLADATGHITQQRFQNVQQRLGVFATQCPFAPPPQRVVQPQPEEPV